MDVLKSPAEQIADLYRGWSGHAPDFILPLPSSGSYRQYFRVGTGSNPVIAGWNADIKENHAFIYFSRHLRSKKLPVPEIYIVGQNGYAWLEEDLGNITLLARYQELMEEKNTTAIEILYRQVMDDLVQFQILGREEMDISRCYPRSHFDRQSMYWDLNYFKYYFLKFARITFDEQTLENDFNEFISRLLEADTHYFLYRDFQSRNIMVTPRGNYYIDYQGARLGAAQYDPASVLFEAKTHIADDLRESLLEHYVESFCHHTGTKPADFLCYFYSYALIRQLQAMGAYGFRGLHEQKPLFLESIPYALQNLKAILPKLSGDYKMPALRKALADLVENEGLRAIGKSNEKLTIRIYSFSYRSGIPFDEALHGGGFVFDCRGLPNPGREDKYKSFTGRDREVVAYFQAYPQVEQFLHYAEKILDIHVSNYLERGLTDMMVSFGCTGGRHRSVYCAETMAALLYKKWPGLNFRCIHTGLPSPENHL